MSVHHAMSMLLPVLALACSTAAAQGAAPEPPESTTPQHDDAAAPASTPFAKSFVDAESYFTSSAEIDAWYGLLRELDDDFDVVCGDTFCEGDFTNYMPLRFRCSVEERAGTIGSCVWVLAASIEEIVPSTGDVEVDARIFLCEMPVAPDTAVTDLVEALSAPSGRAINAALPGTDRSLYDGLVECL